MSLTLLDIVFSSTVPEVKLLVETDLFADDLVIFIPCKTISTGESVLQSATDRLESWANNNGLKFSPTKITAFHFCHIRRCQHSINLYLQGISISSSHKGKFLVSPLTKYFPGNSIQQISKNRVSCDSISNVNSQQHLQNLTIRHLRRNYSNKMQLQCCNILICK